MVDKKVEFLKSLGLEKLAERIERKREAKRKITIAIATYKYVNQEDIDEYNIEIGKFNKRLKLEEIKNYRQLPPDDVLEALKKAQQDNCFDDFYIAFVENVKDPILFGTIKDFKNLYFYIAQWGDDVKIEDILKD